MHPRAHAEVDPDKPAVIMAGSGESLTYGELEERSARLARYWWSEGLRPDDHVAILAENHLHYFEVMWAALRSGLHFTAISRHLTGAEAGYILGDSGASCLVSTAAMADTAVAALEHAPECRLPMMLDGTTGRFSPYEDALASASPEALPTEPKGEMMLYSSGTTGRPKGIRRPLTGRAIDDPANMPLIAPLLGMDETSITLVPAPLYHSAPMVFSYATHVVGGTLVCMERFDPVEALRTIERHRVTHGQWVPTHFIRMLKATEADRGSFDVSSLRAAAHTAAPCPVDVKQKMIEWWGPVFYEYYGGTEGNGLTFCDSEEWLAHPGTVGKAIRGTLRICGDDGEELPVGSTGTVYFEMPALPFAYHNDPEQTASVVHPLHPTWSTLGDVGHVDEDGYLYLSDRKTFMIVSGGVNIYPQEIENRLVAHPAVLDAAVIGVPNDDMGEEVKAVVELVDGVEGSPELAQELIEFVRAELAHYKAPRSVDFTDSLPRLSTGKLYKRLLRDEYWADRERRIA